MASSITLAGDWLHTLGSKRMTQGTGNLGTYATDGIAVTAAQVGLGVLEDLQVSPVDGYVFEYDKANGKVKAYEAGADAAPLDEVGATDISASVFRFRAVGT
jgi:hypothetical protein